MSETR